MYKVFIFLKLIFYKIVDFLSVEVKPKVRELTEFDYIEMIIALLPLAVFGFLIFGYSAILVVLVSLAVCVGIDTLINLIIKRKKVFDYSSIVMGLLLGLCLNGNLNLLVVASVAGFAAVLRKVLFKKDSGLRFTFAILLSRELFAIIFGKAFTTYLYPFLNLKTAAPVELMLKGSLEQYSAKYYFFGLQAGNIGETSVILALLGGIYLIFRRFINPYTPISFILASAVLSCIFKENLAVTLLGSGLVFAAFFMTMDYGFVIDNKFKKSLYGVVCAVFTFVIRKIIKTDGIYFAVLITDLLVFYVNRQNIAKVVTFFKKFKKVKSE